MKFYGSAGRCALLDDSCHVLQPPGGTAARPVPSVVQRCSDASQGLTVLAHTADLIQHCLLAGVWVDVLSVSAKPVAELDIAHSLAVGTLVAPVLPGPFPNPPPVPLA